MSVRIMSQVWGADLADSEMLILLALADWSNDDGECWPSIRQLCTKTRKSERTIQSAIKSMVAAGHMSRVEVPGRGCRYTIHPRSDCAPAKSAPPQRTTRTPAAAADNTSIHTNTSQKASPSSRSRASEGAKAFHRLPADWQPSPLPTSLQAKVDQWPPGEVDDQRDQFRAWAVNAKPEKGKGLKLDWDAAWGNWLRKHDSERPLRNVSRFDAHPARRTAGNGRTIEAALDFIGDGERVRSRSG